MGDTVVFVRGKDTSMQARKWDRVYVASLFTWELPKTLEMLRFYAKSVPSERDLIVGGIGATLMPDFFKDKIGCRVVQGLINQVNMLGHGSRAVAHMTPDYDLFHAVDYNYKPLDAYFVRVTQGCPNSCNFCAVPKLEPKFGHLHDLKQQIETIKSQYSDKQDLIVLDNNILALPSFNRVIEQIIDCGFSQGARIRGRKRIVDFNQGIDARLIARNPSLAKQLGRIPVDPIRLAFDFLSRSMERDYRSAVKLLAEQGFNSFTTYLLYNYHDSPEDFYRRLEINAELNEELGIRISGFPMRYIPITDLKRGYVAPKWNWRWLRGIQCVLQATHGLVSPNPIFMRAAFGKNRDEFFRILSMPDRYIIYREHYKSTGETTDWTRKFGRLSADNKKDLFAVLERLNKERDKSSAAEKLFKLRGIVDHYYPRREKPGGDIFRE